MRAESLSGCCIADLLRGRARDLARYIKTYSAFLTIGLAYHPMRHSQWNLRTYGGLIPWGATQARGRIRLRREPTMILLLTFATIFVVGQAMNVGLALIVERFSDSVSLALFFGLFAVVVVAGWQLAVR